jgi:serine/threonine protein kinase
MKGLYAKVVAGKFDEISPFYSSDFKNIIKQCLQVKSSDRPTCDKILAMPGLLNHLTGTLEDIDCQAPPQEENESLLKTIKMPRRMGEITERLPAPQYETGPKSMKRNNSLPTTSDRLLAAEVKKSPSEVGSVSSGSPQSNGGTKSRAALQNLANRAQRNMDLPIIVENTTGNEEEETLRTNKGGLYRAPQRSALSRDASIQRKNRGIIQNAGLAAPLASNKVLSNLPPKANYHSSNPNVHHSAQLKANMRLYRDLNDKQNPLEQKGAELVHDTKTPIILSQKARYMREQLEAQSHQQLVLPKIPLKQHNI